MRWDYLWDATCDKRKSPYKIRIFFEKGLEVCEHLNAAAPASARPRWVRKKKAVAKKGFIGDKAQSESGGRIEEQR